MHLLPELVTEPASRYLSYYQELVTFLVFLSNLVASSDEELSARQLWRTAQSSGHPGAARRADEVVASVVDRGKAKRGFRPYLRLVSEMTLTRSTDNFLAYVSELLGLIFVTRPQTLRSSEKVEVEEVLQCSTMDELIRSLAEQKVDRLAYKGMRDLAADLSSRHHFRLFETDSDLSRAAYIIECRNSVVHNRGVVNKTFIRRTGSKLRVGSPAPLSVNDVIESAQFLTASALDIDVRATSKFSLAAKSLSRIRSIPQFKTSPVSTPK
jgi:hypothetical protein